MKLFSRVALPLAALAAVAFAAPASATHDRHHDAAAHAGKADVVAALHHMGFVSWDEIEFDDGYWEIDDAVRHNGRQFDLKLHPVTLEVVHKEFEGVRRVKHHR